MKIAFIGFGAQALENIIPCCQIIPGVEVAAICDVNPQRRSEAEKIFGAKSVYSSHQTMMDKVRPDAVVAACYPSDHYQIALDAIDRRIPVFIEKPPVPSYSHLKHLVNRALTEGVTTGVGMNFRFAEVTTRLQRISDNQIDMITLRQFANKPTTPLWDYTSLVKSFLHAMTIHGLDFLIHLCGPVESLDVVNKIDDQMLFTVLLKFKGGAHASLISGNTTPHFVFDFDAVCRGNIHVSSSALWEMKIAETGKRYLEGESKKWTDSWSPSPLSSGFQRSGYMGQFIDFITAIRENRESSSSFESMLETYRCMDEIEALLINSSFKQEKRAC